MKKSGFTLIELLAVIVILAIIALITIPAVLRMTENAKISSYRRSVDLYGKAINSAINLYKSDKIEKKESYSVSFENVSPYVDYEGNDIICDKSIIYSDDTVFLSECTVEGNKVYAENDKGYGTNNYYYYTNAIKRIKALLYVEAVNKALQGKENIGNSCKIENSNLTCNNQPIEVTGELGNPKSGTLVITNNKVTGYSNLKFEDEKAQTQEEVPQVVDEQQTSVSGSTNNGSNTYTTYTSYIDDNNQNNSNNVNNNQNITNLTDNYIGYYADVDGDGTVDGVIYADLAHSKSGDFYNKDTNSYQSFGTYSYESRSNLKEYTISEENSSITTFGTNKIITLKPGSTGNSRFYVMALENFTIGSNPQDFKGQYHWYRKAYGKMNDSDTNINFGTGYVNTGNMIRIWNKNGTGVGSYDGATQDYQDIWKHIQDKYEEGWYIPSRGEWTAFADYLANRTNHPLTSNKFDSNNNSYDNSGNYDDIYHLSNYYWSSSQDYGDIAWVIYFDYGFIFNKHVDDHSYVRLGITF